MLTPLTGADIRDSSGDQWRYMVQINEEDVNFDLSPELEKQRLRHIEMKEKLHDRGLVVVSGVHLKKI